VFRSLRLGKFFGIDLYVHGTFWLLPLLILFSALSAGATAAEAGVEVLFVFAVFGCVVLHEVGHALAARTYGIATRDITLYPIGGMASLERIPERPWREIAIALAGPAVNLVIAGALLAGMFAGVLFFPWSPEGPEGLDPLSPEVFAAKVLWANLILAGFNLLPCFPMDGGRVFRALLATRLDRIRATEIAVGVGSVVAGLFVALGLYLGYFGLLLLAFVVYLLGQAELAAVRAKAATREFRARVDDWFEGPEAPRSDGPTVPPGFSGLLWDERRRLWIQYVDGVAVREIAPGA
jgi:Zn-dependent protease